MSLAGRRCSVRCLILWQHTLPYLTLPYLVILARTSVRSCTREVALSKVPDVASFPRANARRRAPLVHLCDGGKEPLGGGASVLASAKANKGRKALNIVEELGERAKKKRAQRSSLRWAILSIKERSGTVHLQMLPSSGFPHSIDPCAAQGFDSLEAPQLRAIQARTSLAWFGGLALCAYAWPVTSTPECHKP